MCREDWEVGCGILGGGESKSKGLEEGKDGDRLSDCLYVAQGGKFDKDGFTLKLRNLRLIQWLAGEPFRILDFCGNLVRKCFVMTHQGQSDA